MKTDLEFWRRNSELLEAELAALRRRAKELESNFETLQRALVGETGASGITVATALRKDAERYLWHRARNPSSLLLTEWGASKAACEIGDDCDAATDAAMREAAK